MKIRWTSYMCWNFASILAISSVAALAASVPLSGRVIFPALGLKNNSELIEKIRLDVECGHIEGVNSIPLGWSISIVRRAPGSEKLEAEADHGATRLATLGAFNGGVRVASQDQKCFGFKATIFISGEADRKIEFTETSLKLAP